MLEPAFVADVNVQDYPFLKSHVLNHRAVMPVAMMVDWFGHGALHANPGLKFHGVHGLRVLKGITVDAFETRSVVLCATGPVGAWGGNRLLRDEYDLVPTVLTGPATDNEVGGAYIQSSLGVPTANALTEPERLVEHVWQSVFESEAGNA